MQIASLSLRSLRYLVAVADAGSVTGAARRLHVSQPSISEAVAALEAELGVALLLRHHARGVTLTPAGSRVVAEARLLLRHAEDFVHAAASLGAEAVGEVSMGCFLTLAPRYLPALLAGLGRDIPGLSVRVEEGDHNEMLAGLEAGRTEIALTYDFEMPPGLTVTPIAQLAPVAVLPTRHRLARGARVRLADLVAEPFLLLDLPHSRDYFAGIFRAAGLTPRIAFRSRSQELLRGLVGNGLGWTIQNVQPESPYAIDGTRITSLPLDAGLPAVRLVLAAAPGPASRPAVRALARYIEAAFQKGGVFDPQYPRAGST
ncbi:LysR family transcriptional regulator [Sediminicoccus sp. BL-A-41-H5]|uniref:LysR family transcriptional regulator n=1 Tax=Sediminicoccus sp. BL-A-41-H5 TaxID=3421106 RepID=UPI003D67B2E2